MCIKTQVNRIKLKFLMCLERLRGCRSEDLEFFFRGGRNRNQTCHETFHIPPSFFFLLIYSDELINPSLSCHKVPLSVWTYGTKANDAKRWNRAISLQLNCACLFLLTLHQAAPASPLSASVFGSQMWCERSILSDAACYFVSSRLLLAAAATAACTLMVFHCHIPQVILNLQLALFKSFSRDVCFKERVNS